MSGHKHVVHTCRLQLCTFQCAFIHRIQLHTYINSYLYSGFLINSITISLCGWICSIFSIRQRKGVGLILPPYTPPMWSSAMALSTNSSATEHNTTRVASKLHYRAWQSTNDYTSRMPTEIDTQPSPTVHHYRGDTAYLWGRNIPPSSTCTHKLASE